MKRVLLLLPSTTYRARDFLEAASRMGVTVVVGTEGHQALEEKSPGRTLTLDISDTGAATEAILRYNAQHPLQAVVGTDDETTLLATEAATALGLRANPLGAVALTRNKFKLRRALAEAGLPSPFYRLLKITDDPRAAAGEIPFPCVLKPTCLSASRGVIRADDADAFDAAFYRIAGLLADPDVRRRSGDAAEEILVEGYIPGEEYAVEGLLERGRFTLLALFDKPDPLEGPHFEETIYVTPSRAGKARQAAIVEQVRLALVTVGLREGPIHAELRCNDAGAYLLEIAARSIGGRCARVLRFGAGISLETLVLRHALGKSCEGLAREPGAAGVMMIPIPRGGVLRGVENIDAARAVAGIEDIDIAIARGQPVTPLPDGNRYLGFIFARGGRPEEVEAALREAHARLEIAIE